MHPAALPHNEVAHTVTTTRHQASVDVLDDDVMYAPREHLPAYGTFDVPWHGYVFNSTETDIADNMPSNVRDILFNASQVEDERFVDDVLNGLLNEDERFAEEAISSVFGM